MSDNAPTRVHFACHVPDGDDSATPPSPHSDSNFDGDSDDSDDRFNFGSEDPRRVRVVKSEYGEKSEENRAMFQNPTVRLAVAMEMSSALPTAMNVQLGKKNCCRKYFLGRHAQALPQTFGHSCFICVLIFYILAIILQLMFFAHAPVPFEYMDEYFDLDPFPLLERVWLREFSLGYEAPEDQLRMSPLPIYKQHCNYSHSNSETDPDLVHFNVHLWLNDPLFDKTREEGGLEIQSVYPLILASSNWDAWWVVADRNVTYPTPYFRSHVVTQEFRFVTPECGRPPEVVDSGRGAVPDVDKFTTHGTFLAACVVWDPHKVSFHRRNDVLSKDQLGLYCDAFGGLGGKPCNFGAAAEDIRIQGNKDHIFVSNPDMHAQAIRIPHANFSGEITLSECEFEGWAGWDPVPDQCLGAASRFSEWACHTCVDDTLDFFGPWPHKRPWRKVNGTATTTSPPSTLLIYKSFPRFDVTLRGAINVTHQPRVYLLTAPLEPDGEEHNLNGPWTKLYDFGKEFRPGWPQAMEEPEKEFEKLSKAWEEPTGFEAALLDETDNSMLLQELNKASIKPVSPFGPRGKMYIVACLVNRTTYDMSYNFTLGQEVRGPPFNDRCVAVTGRCAHACIGRTDLEDIDHCDEFGNVLRLVERIDPPRNDSMFIRILMLTMICSFAVKLLTYLPGLFQPYPHCAKYNHVMTQMLGYIVVAVPTAGESKAVVCRNLIGAVACMPKHCSCRYHVVLIDEGHRKSLRETWRKFCRILELLLLYGVSSEDDGNHIYISGAEDMLLDGTQRARSTVILKMFMKFWCEDTRKMTLKHLEAKPIAKVDAERLSGRTALARTFVETGLEQAEMGKLARLCDNLLKDLQDTKKISENIHVDFAEDWPPGEIPVRENNRDSREVFFHGIGVDVGWRATDSVPILLQLPLRLHYLARARPPEDERTIKVQEVAPGTWSYVLPANAFWQDWMELRQNAAPYESGLETALRQDENFVPLWTSRGKAGGLNFGLNYMHWYAGLLDEAQKEDRDALGICRSLSDFSYLSGSSSVNTGGGGDSANQHILFSICDARHQYQPDFMHRVVPYFFKPGAMMFELDKSVSFCQTPQYFPEINEGLDFLDNNNAQFFRLNCMLRNCCGGVSSCGTNGTWLIPPREVMEIWANPSRVLGAVASKQMHEFCFFHECCKIEDTASSLEQVLRGKRSQYANYRLSYGLAKNPTDYLAAVQRWAEGGVVLSLQTFTLSLDQNNFFLYIFVACYVWFLTVMIRGLASDSNSYHTFFPVPLKHYLPWDWDDTWKESFQYLLYQLYDQYSEVEMDIHAKNFGNAMTVIAALIIQLVCLWVLTELSGCVKRCTGKRFFPSGGRFWGRLMISFDNLTYFFWFWTALFWITFNFANVFLKKTFYYDIPLMTFFAFTGQGLSWALIISASARNSKHEMLEANEVASIGVTTIWRGTQLFYMTTPLTMYSIAMGFLDFLKWRNFNQDISYWTGGDRGATTKNLVKWWCLLLLAGVVFSWIWFFMGMAEGGAGAAASVIVVTFIGMDVLHPCAYLWLGDPQFADESETQRLASYTTCCERIKDKAWWRRKAFYCICNSWLVSIIKWMGPLNQVAMPFTMLALPQLGLNQAFTLLINQGNR